MENVPVTNLKLVPVKPVELNRLATDVAGICKEIVLKTAMMIQGKKYVRVEGWQSIATTHGCVAGSTGAVAEYNPRGELIGFKAIGKIRRLTDGKLLATAEGYVGSDEPVWFGGFKDVWNEKTNRWESKEYQRRPDYAIRAMAQTRAISRVCRSAFAHVVTLMDAGLSTTPAEEVPEGEFQDNVPPRTAQAQRSAPAAAPQAPQTPKASAPKAKSAPATAQKTASQSNQQSDWKTYPVPFGKNQGIPLGQLPLNTLKWYCENIQVQEVYEANGTTIQCSAENIAKQRAFRAALDEAVVEVDFEGQGQ